jgi:hypothetical protein
MKQNSDTGRNESAVRFRFADTAEGVRFTIGVADRPATRLDYISMLLGGNVAQRSTWIRTAERVVEVSGGMYRDGVQHIVIDLDIGSHRLSRWMCMSGHRIAHGAFTLQRLAARAGSRAASPRALRASGLGSRGWRRRRPWLAAARADSPS